ncbi:MAG: ATP phosphoribosyltransferase regulatory subunit, partial [Myxococcales bacterium]|nr:ATP phosphoribosyltransferase regulatory subunit [Myxococcales bacterium]
MSARPTFAPLPPGARDLLPPVLRRRRRLQERALAVFEAWGYAPVATPAVEYFEVFGRGLTEAERQRCLRFIAPGAEEVEVLRSDVTPQIARLVAQRLRDRLEAGELIRLAYAADVIRKPAAADEAAEEHQVGVELIGDRTAAGDAELVALADAVLDRCGVAGAVFDLAHVGVARSVLDDLEIGDALRRPLITRLARKDLAGLDAILGEAGASDAARAELRALASLHGSVDVIDRARAVLGAAARRSLDEIAAVVDAVRGVAPAVLERLSIDLGEIRGHDYYSGLRLRVWAPGSPRPLLRGGRYDGLLRRYGVDAPATGLVIGLDDVERLTSE